MAKKLLPTTLVGSYPQPEWLINRGMLASNTPPRVRMRELWRVDADLLEQAQDDARSSPSTIRSEPASTS